MMLLTRHSMETVLFHDEFIKRCVAFYSTVAEYLNTVMIPGWTVGQTPTLPLPNDVPFLFAHLPEWYVEDIAEFLLFALQ